MNPPAGASVLTTVESTWECCGCSKAIFWRRCSSDSDRAKRSRPSRSHLCTCMWHAACGMWHVARARKRGTRMYMCISPGAQLLAQRVVHVHVHVHACVRVHEFRRPAARTGSHTPRLRRREPSRPRPGCRRRSRCPAACGSVGPCTRRRSPAEKRGPRGDSRGARAQGGCRAWHGGSGERRKARRRERPECRRPSARRRTDRM